MPDYTQTTPKEYPKRVQFFALRFCRLLEVARVASEIGAVGAYFLTVIAVREDSLHYRRGVRFWDSEIQEILDLSKSQVQRIRRRLIDAGWLHAQRKNRRSVTEYWVQIPVQYQAILGQQPNPISIMGDANTELMSQGSASPVTPEARQYRANNPLISVTSDATSNPIPKEEEESIPSKKKKKNFTKPTFDELESYISQNSLNVNAGKFIDYYDSNGWMVSKNPMKDWQAAARNWSRRNEDGSRSASWKQNNKSDHPADVPGIRCGPDGKPLDGSELR